MHEVYSSCKAYILFTICSRSDFQNPKKNKDSLEILPNLNILAIN